MCTLTALFEIKPPHTLQPGEAASSYWVWFDCGTALKCFPDSPLRTRLMQVLPCPVHHPQGWDTEALRVERIGVVADVATDAKALNIP